MLRYKTLQFHPNETKEGWQVIVSSVDTNGPMPESQPSSMGVFHYPETMSDVSAFARLQSTMIKAHEAEINRLQNSLALLLDLTLPASETVSSDAE